MPESSDTNILMGAEWDGTAVEEGVNELVVQLAKARDAQKNLRDQITETNKALDANVKSLETTKAALAKATDPAEISKLKDAEKQLVAENQNLARTLAQQKVDFEVVRKGVSVYNQQVTETIKNNRLAGESLQRFTNLNRLGGQVVETFTGTLRSAALGIVSGFAGGIISTAIPALIDLAKSLFDTERGLNSFAERQKIANEIFASASKSVGDDVARLEIFKIKLNDLNIPANERIRIAKEYNKTAEETNQIDTKQINNLDLINQKIEAQNKLIIQRAVSLAATSKLGEAAAQFVDKRLQLTEAVKATGLDEATARSQVNFLLKIRESLGQASEESLKGRDELSKFDKEINRIFGSPRKAALFKQLFADTDEAQKKLEDLGANLSLLIDPEGLIKFSKPPTTKTLEDQFAVVLADLNKKLSNITRKTFESDDTIRNQFSESLKSEIEKIKKQFEKDTRSSGVPGQTRVEVLVDLATRINEAQLAKSLDDFHNKILEAQKRLNDAIEQLDHEAALKRINNIRDDFERQRQLIDEGADSLKASLLNKQADLLAQVDKLNVNDTEKGLRKSVITSIFSGLLDQNEVNRNEKQMDNSFNQFLKVVKDGNREFEDQILASNEDEGNAILKQTQLYESHKITYKKYQDRITDIVRTAKEQRDTIRLAELNNELKQKEAFLATATDQQIKDRLEEDIRRTRAEIADLNKQTTQPPGPQQDDPSTKRIENLKKYVAATGQLLQTIVGFWQQVNQAEQQSLERSIQVQTRRVDNARDIADKGNAEFLEMEQKRLDELEAKKERSAQRQLVINNALVLSNALLAAVSAIASAAQAPAGSGPFLAIAAGIAVLGAIAATFSFVSSLQPPAQTFFKGEESVKQGKSPSGIDTVPARLTVGERVVTAKENKDYFPALTAIHNRKVAPEVLNSFVENYYQGKGGEKIVEKTFTIKQDQSHDLISTVVNNLSEKVDRLDKRQMIRVEGSLRHEITRIIDSRYAQMVVPIIMQKLIERERISTDRFKTVELQKIITQTILSKHDEYRRSFEKEASAPGTVGQRDKSPSAKNVDEFRKADIDVGKGRDDSKDSKSQELIARHFSSVIDKSTSFFLDKEKFVSDTAKALNEKFGNQSTQTIANVEKVLHERIVERDFEKRIPFIIEKVNANKEVVRQLSMQVIREGVQSVLSSVVKNSIKEYFTKITNHDTRTVDTTKIGQTKESTEKESQKSDSKISDTKQYVEKERTQSVDKKSNEGVHRIGDNNLPRETKKGSDLPGNIKNESNEKETSKIVEKSDSEKLLQSGDIVVHKEGKEIVHEKDHEKIDTSRTEKIIQGGEAVLPGRILPVPEGHKATTAGVDKDEKPIEQLARNPERVLQLTTVEQQYRERQLRDESIQHYSKSDVERIQRERSFFINNNQEYHSAIQSIFNRTVPAIEINNFVERTIEKALTEKSDKTQKLFLEKITIPSNVINSFIQTHFATVIPRVNYERLSQATESSKQIDNAETNYKLDKINGTVEKVVEAVAALGINVNFDEEGFALSLSKYNHKRKMHKLS